MTEYIINKEEGLFIKVDVEQVDKSAVTDVIKQDRNIIRYKSLLQILKSIHFLFFPKKKESVADKS